VLVGDAELDEGSNHEAIALAGRLGLDRLTVVVVDNGTASHGWPGGIVARFEIEGWVSATVDGRDHDALEAALAITHVGQANGGRRRRGARIVTAGAATAETMRIASIGSPAALLDEDPRLAVVLADIGSQASSAPGVVTRTASSTSASASS
jgi:hypothetical protein